MDKKIPIYFDSIIVESPFQEISKSTPNIGRLKVRVFTKYGNRNGSYITENVANQLIKSATTGNVPVVGFFDPETKTWASHSGPTLANAYGYVEDFLGWEPFLDTDNVEREYAVFSVILFTNYYEEAKNILGQNQSMELDPASITGDWTMINNEEYFVYKTANMLGFCIIGEHEPCFSVSAFFSKNDNNYNSQFEKFSSLLSDLKTQVEEAEKINRGGEQQMNDFLNQEQEVLENEEVVEEQTPQVFEQEEETVVEEETVLEIELDNNNSSESEEEQPAEETPNEFEALQQRYNELESNYNELQTNYENAQNRIAELETFQENSNVQIEGLQNQISELQQTLTAYQSQIAEAENQKKSNLVEKYEKVLSVEEIAPIRAGLNDFSYEELNSKLAVIFAENKMAEHEVDKIPLPEQPESQFALFMKKHKKK